MTNTADISISHAGSNVRDTVITLEHEDPYFWHDFPDEDFEWGYVPGTRHATLKIKNVPPGKYFLMMDWGGMGQGGKSLVTTIQATPSLP